MGEPVGPSADSGDLHTEHVVGRLAPTPSGHLHLGNVLAFAAAWLSARAQNGTLLLRIEDIDTSRSKREIADIQRRELEWLGLVWDREVPQQRTRNYETFFDQLCDDTYRCECTRAQIRETGGIYLGTCRDAKRLEGAVRLRLEPGEVSFRDRQFGIRRVDPTVFGDPVLLRRDGIISYNLAVVADDIRDGVTEVVRGADLLDYTAVQIKLYEKLGHRPPSWSHFPLVLGPDQKKLSKSHGAFHVGALQDAGWRPADIWRAVLPFLGIRNSETLEEGVLEFESGKAASGPLLLHIQDDDIPSPSEGLKWSTQRGDT